MQWLCPEGGQSLPHLRGQGLFLLLSPSFFTPQTLTEHQDVLMARPGAEDPEGTDTSRALGAAHGPRQDRRGGGGGSKAGGGGTENGEGAAPTVRIPHLRAQGSAFVEGPRPGCLGWRGGGGLH